MIDGVKCVCNDIVPTAWAAVPLLDFGVRVSEATGELLTPKREAKRDGLTFRTNGNYCQMFGSLHTFKNGGGTNADNFTFDELQRVINDLQTNYNINPSTTNIQHLEIGVNIPLDYSPEIVIKSVISHRGRAFTPLYDRKRHRVGKVCERSNYTLKLYDKGKQVGTGANILRFEYVAHRQRNLEPCGVRTLADLTNRRKYALLLGLLLSAVPDMVFYDFKYKGAGMTATQWKRFQRYSNPNYWEGLTNDARQKALPRYFAVVEKYRLIDWRRWLYHSATKQGLFLLGIKPENGNFCHDFLSNGKRDVLAAFAALECSVAKAATTNGRGGSLEAKKQDTETGEKVPYHSTTKTRRFCVVCGRDITDQKEGSRFCSERLHGKEARKCRNKDSNRRLAIKRKIYRAMENGKYLLITYECDGVLYTDILQPEEISLTREWLDRVRKMETTDKPKQSLTGKQAREYVKQLQKQEVKK